MDDKTIIFAAIGDLEVTRRQLLLQIQERDQRIADLEAQLAALVEHEEDDDDPRNAA